MEDNYNIDKQFERIDSLRPGEYDNCTFSHCDLSGKDLSGLIFIDCTFSHCNLSLAKLGRTAFREVVFKDCKMLGLRFDTCHEFGLSFSFEGCQLGQSSFFKTKIKKTIFKNTQMRETDFAEADLTEASFENCDLAQAIFDHTILEKADFRTAYNFTIDPEINRVKKAKFSRTGIAGLLDKYEIEID